MLRIDIKRLTALRREYEGHRAASLDAEKRVIDLRDERDRAVVGLRRARGDGYDDMGQRGQRKSQAEIGRAEHAVEVAEQALAEGRAASQIAGEKFKASQTLLGNCQRVAQEMGVKL